MAKDGNKLKYGLPDVKNFSNWPIKFICSITELLKVVCTFNLILSMT